MDENKTNTMTLEFIDKDLNTIISMSDFIHTKEYVDYYTICLKIKFDCFYAQKKIDIELSEFINFYNSLERIQLYNKPNEFYLFQLDNYFEMHFINFNGNELKIEVSLYSVNYIGKLHFNFFMSKKEIFRLNMKIKDIINI